MYTDVEAVLDLPEETQETIAGICKCGCACQGYGDSPSAARRQEMASFSATQNGNYNVNRVEMGG